MCPEAATWHVPHNCRSCVKSYGSASALAERAPHKEAQAWPMQIGLQRAGAGAPASPRAAGCPPRRVCSGPAAEPISQRQQRNGGAAGVASLPQRPLALQPWHAPRPGRAAARSRGQRAMCALLGRGGHRPTRVGGCSQHKSPRMANGIVHYRNPPELETAGTPAKEQVPPPSITPAYQDG